MERFEAPQSIEYIAPPPENSWRLLESDETTEFQTYDGVRITEEGEAWLDLGDLMHLLLKRDTEAQFIPNEMAVNKLSDINIAFPETPLLQQLVLTMHIHRGGFLGDKMKDDGALALTTPNAVIIISGTKFFIAYDPDAEITWVGNFDGTIDIADIELEEGISLPDRRLIAIPAVRGRTFWPIHEHMTYEEFERLIDLLESPIAVADLISGPYAVVEFAPNIPVRSGPGPAFANLGTLSNGDYARIIGQSGGWWQIMCPAIIIDSGTGCWIAGEPITTNYNTEDVPEVTTSTATATPTPTTSPTPEISSCSSPRLISPGIGSAFARGHNPVLSWTYDCALGPNEWFDVRLWQEGDPHFGKTWTKDHYYTLDHKIFAKRGTHFWSVAVVQGQNGVVDAVIAEEAPARWFDWRVDPITPTPTPTLTPTPTFTPTPTPTSTPCPGLCTGDIQITLRWNNETDLDLYVTDPNNETIFRGNEISSSGGIMDMDANHGCSVSDNSPTENIFWPEGGAPDGTYVVKVLYFLECENAGATNFNVTVLVDGISNTYPGTLSTNDPMTKIIVFCRPDTAEC